MSWKKFESFGENFTPKISIRATGHIGFSRGAVNKFGLHRYQYCELLYDEERKMIGIKFTNDETSGVTTKLVKRDIDCFISAKPFLNYFGVEYKPTKSYYGEHDEESGLVVIDLGKPVIVHTKRSRKSTE